MLRKAASRIKYVNPSPPPARRSHPGARSATSRHSRAYCACWRRNTEPWAIKPDRKSTRLNSSHLVISYAVFCLKKKNQLRQSAKLTQTTLFLTTLTHLEPRSLPCQAVPRDTTLLINLERFETAARHSDDT